MKKDKNRTFIPKLARETPSKRKRFGNVVFYRDNPEINKFDPAWDGVQFLGYSDKNRLGLFVVGEKGKIKDVVDVATLKKYHNYNRMQEDVFISLNSLGFVNGKISRDQKHVCYLNRLWADIDCDTPEDASLILYELTENVFGKSLPVPSYVMFSGTGLWLFWAISAPMKAIGKWHVCQQHIYEVLKEYGADNAVVHDIARVCRYAGSYNSKGFFATDGKLYHNRVGIVNYTGEIHSLDQFISNYVEESLRGKKFFTSNTAAFAYAMDKNNKGYLKDLDKLIQIREKDLTGSRELYFFIMRVLLSRLGYTDEDAVEYMRLRNNSLNLPLTDKELVKATGSASRYSERYGFGSSYITRALSITDEEMQYLSVLTSKEQKKEHKKEYDKSRYKAMLKKTKKKTKSEDIRIKLSKMRKMLEKGTHKSDICKTLKISNSTYYNYIAMLKEIEESVNESKKVISNRGDALNGRSEKRNVSESISHQDTCKNSIKDSKVKKTRCEKPVKPRSTRSNKKKSSFYNCLENPSILVNQEMNNYCESGAKYSNIFLNWSPKFFIRNYKEQAPKGLRANYILSKASRSENDGGTE